MTASTNEEPKEVEKKLLKNLFEEDLAEKDLAEKLLMKELRSSSCTLLTTLMLQGCIPCQGCARKTRKIAKKSTPPKWTKK